MLLYITAAAASCIRGWVASPKRTNPVDHLFQRIAIPTVVVPVASGWPLNRATAVAPASLSVHGKVVMAAERLMQFGWAIGSASADVRSFQIDVDYVRHRRLVVTKSMSANRILWIDRTQIEESRHSCVLPPFLDIPGDTAAAATTQ
jgi:hypothetical protein